MTVFNPVLDGRDLSHQRSTSPEIVFLKAQGLLFTGRTSREYEACVHQLVNQGKFDSFINSLGSAFKEGLGVFTAVSCVAAAFQFGACRSKGGSLSVLRLAFEASRTEGESSSTSTSSPAKAPKSAPLDQLGENKAQASRESISQAAPLTFGIFRVGLHRSCDVNVYPLIHVFLAFVWSLCLTPRAMSFIDMYIPWHEIIEFLNKHASLHPSPAARAETFPQPSRERTSWLLLEDFTLRGQIWTEPYLPETLFLDPGIDWEEKDRELPSMAETRNLRIQWLAHRLASNGTYIKYDEETGQFATTPTANKLQADNPLPALPEPVLQPSYEGGITSALGKQKGHFAYASETPQHRSPRESQRKARKDQTRPKPSMSKTPQILKREPKADTEMTDAFQIKQQPVEQLPSSSNVAPDYKAASTEAPFGDAEGIRKVKIEDFDPGGPGDVMVVDQSRPGSPEM